MASYRITKGLDIPLTGAPAADVEEVPLSRTVVVQPPEFEGLRPRLLVKEGDTVRRGTALVYHRRNENYRIVSPAAGKVSAIVLGERRSLRRIEIETAATDEAEPYAKYTADQVGALSRDELLLAIQRAGLLPLFRQRPFSHIADPAATPKSIFVNGMNTAPFQPDLHAAVRGEEQAFQAGLDALARLTPGSVHLCLGERSPSPSSAVTGARNVEIHTFSGPHPSGNSSVHIHFIDPIAPNNVVWTIRGVDVILLGRFLLSGEFPATRVLSLGGPGVKVAARRHYRVRVGTPIRELLANRLEEGEQRVVAGDMLSGRGLLPDEALGLQTASLTVLPEGRERHLLGWMAPGLNRFSQSRAYLSRWMHAARSWALNTNENGSHRAMVLTGWYDRVMPMRIMTDFLVRAVLARDTDEAVQLGLLEVDPEDFALGAFICPSKTDLVSIIRRGLAELEREGV